MDRTDGQLLQDHLGGDASAFAELSRRHVDLVYASALRRCANRALADDVTQAVFVLLAAKAKSLRHRTTVAGWLVLATRHVARTALRTQARRLRHERAAARPEGAVMPKDDSRQSDYSAEVVAVLDDAMDRLKDADRDAVALRFIENRSFAEVGTALGVGEEAARKRVTRALDRLRSILARQGVVVPAAAMAGTLISFAAAPAPAAVLAAASLPSATASAHAVALSKGTLHMFAIQKAAAVVAAITVSVSAVAGVGVLAQSTTPPPAAPPARAAAAVPTNIGEYYVSGSVEQPGAYALNGRNITLRQALISARASSDALSVGVIRRTDSREEINWYSMADVTAGRVDLPLRPDDIVDVRTTAVPTSPNVASMAMLMAVSDVRANLTFFQSLGFQTVWQDAEANGVPARATVRSGVVSLRLDQTAPPTPAGGVGVFLWINGGLKALTDYRDSIVAKGVEASAIGPDLQMRKFTVTTPDGYVLNFYAAAQ